MHSIVAKLKWLASAAALWMLGLGGCGPTPGPSGQPPLNREMVLHFGSALAMRDGAVFGDLAAIRLAGRDLAGAPPSSHLPASSEPYSRELLELAAQAAVAVTLRDGLSLAADVANACGTCHQAFDVGPRFVLGSAPPATSLGSHMAGQAWVSRLLWDGIVGPSDDLWDIGAQELTTSPAFPDDMPAAAADPAMLRAAQDRLRDLGEDALVVPEPQAKAEIIAEVWTVCAGCHERAGVRR